MLRSEAQHHAVSYYQAETMKTDRSPDQKSNPKPSRRRRGPTAPQCRGHVNYVVCQSVRAR